MQLNRNRAYAKRPAPAFGFATDEVERWQTPQGRVTTSVRGSHVDIVVRLHRLGSMLWVSLVITAGSSLAWVMYQIFHAFLSGRVNAILGAALNGGR